jgi:hypothetical protein
MVSPQSSGLAAGGIPFCGEGILYLAATSEQLLLESRREALLSEQASHPCQRILPAIHPGVVVDGVVCVAE